jgi:hypothetical protein
MVATGRNSRSVRKPCAVLSSGQALGRRWAGAGQTWTGGGQARRCLVGPGSRPDPAALGAQWWCRGLGERGSCPGFHLPHPRSRHWASQHGSGLSGTRGLHRTTLLMCFELQPGGGVAKDRNGKADRPSIYLLSVDECFCSHDTSCSTLSRQVRGADYMHHPSRWSLGVEQRDLSNVHLHLAWRRWSLGPACSSRTSVHF